MSTSKPTIYFGYGSNLWLSQMSQRCPSSKYLGVARLDGYTWLINDRGYANVVEVTNASTDATSPSPNSTALGASYDNEVYGLVYSLTESDEKQLDKNEGVPIAYTKEYLSCSFWSAGSPSAPMSHHKPVNTSEPPTREHDMLVYIDRNRTSPSSPRKEYIYRMNQGLADAVKLGVPGEYVEQVVRKYIPVEREEAEGEVEAFAKRQAKGFRDESGVFKS